MQTKSIIAKIQYRISIVSTQNVCDSTMFNISSLFYQYKLIFIRVICFASRFFIQVLLEFKSTNNMSVVTMHRLTIIGKDIDKLRHYFFLREQFHQ